MDAAALAGLCLLLARGEGAVALPPGVTCRTIAPASSTVAGPLDGQPLAALLAAPGAREGIARVAFAEAGNQGDSGLAAVVYTILNRLADGRWGGSVDRVLDAPGQFEPVMRVGGDWRALPAVSVAGQARIDTILNLAVEGRLPDLTHGARFFQNPAVVASSARNGEVSPGLVNFGGQTPSAVIGAHSFYTGSGARMPRFSPASVSPPDQLFVGRETTTAEDPKVPNDSIEPGLRTPAAGDPAQALFVSQDGLVQAARP